MDLPQIFTNFLTSKLLNVVPKKPTDVKSIAVLGCVHAPYHDKKFFDNACKLIVDVKPDLIVLNGDIADIISISSHTVGQLIKDNTTLDREYTQINKYLDQIDSLGVAVHYNFGNHEDRFNRFMNKHENSKLGGALIDISTGLMLKRRGYTVNENYGQDDYVVKDLNIIHGVYVGETATKNHWRDNRQNTVIFNHTHRVAQYHCAGRSSYNIGWMADPKSSAFNYKSQSEKQAWQQGFAMVEFDYRTPHVTQIINKNGFVYNGKSYK